MWASSEKWICHLKQLGICLGPKQSVYDGEKEQANEEDPYLRHAGQEGAECGDWAKKTKESSSLQSLCGIVVNIL